MDLPISLEDITYAENYLAQGDLATATPLLERLTCAMPRIPPIRQFRARPPSR